MFEYVNEWLKTKYTVSKGLKRKTLLSLPCSQEVQYVHVHTKGNPSRHLKALLITSNYPKNKLNSRLFELTMYTILAWSNVTDKLIQYCTVQVCHVEQLHVHVHDSWPMLFLSLHWFLQFYLSLSHPEFLSWWLKSSGIRQSKITNKAFLEGKS